MIAKRSVERSRIGGLVVLASLLLGSAALASEETQDAGSQLEREDDEGQATEAAEGESAEANEEEDPEGSADVAEATEEDPSGEPLEGTAEQGGESAEADANEAAPEDDSAETAAVPATEEAAPINESAGARREQLLVPEPSKPALPSAWGRGLYTPPERLRARPPVTDEARKKLQQALDLSRPVEHSLKRFTRSPSRPSTDKQEVEVHGAVQTPRAAGSPAKAGALQAAVLASTLETISDRSQALTTENSLVRLSQPPVREEDWGWLWGLAGLAALLLVPIGVLLTRPTRNL